MEQFLRDVRYGCRMFVKNPGVTLSAVIAFALGIGSTTTMFSITHGLLRDMPFDEPERLVYLSIDQLAGSRFDEHLLSVHEITEWRELQSTLVGLGGFRDADFNLSGTEGRPERVNGARVTANAFDILRENPILGRKFLAEEELPGAEPVVLLGHSIWATRYDADPDILGQTVRLNGVSRTVVGVMPEGFRFPYEEDIWIPIELDQTAVVRGEGRNIYGLGRLRDGASLEEARVEFAGLARRLELAYPDIYDGISMRVINYKEHIVDSEAVIIMNVMLGVVSFVLLIACANVANLLLARAASRSREIAVRTALGASRARVIGQLLAEALAVSTVGGIVGLGLTYVGVTMFNNALTGQIPFFWMVVSIDPAVLIFAFLLVLAASVFAGTAPALKATGVNVNEVLKDETRGVAGLRLGRISRFLVVGEVALSCGLLTVSALMVKGVMLQASSGYSFATDNVLAGQVTLQPEEYPETSHREAYYRELVANVEGRPGVSGAAVSSGFPGLRAYRWRVQVEGTEDAEMQNLPFTRWATVSPEFFQTLGANIIEGRGFTWSDNVESQPVAIVNQRFANRFFPNESPLGRQIRVGLADEMEEWRTIVGVAPDLAMNGGDEEYSDGFYVPVAQRVRRGMVLIVSGPGDPLTLAPLVREVAAGIDPHTPIYQLNSLERTIALEDAPERVFGVLFLVFGLAALLLATVGLYGVMAFSIRRRTREIGIRVALGAVSKRILWLTLKGGLAQLFVGLVIGVCLAAVLAPAMSDMLFAAEPWDWTIYVVVVLCLSATGVAASVIPAARATRVNPMDTLRYE